MLKTNTYKIVLKQIGSLLVILSIVIIVPATICGIYSEWHSFAGFIISGLIIFLIGSELFERFKKAEDPQYKHALIIVASGWMAVALLGGLPFFIIAHLTPVNVMNKFIPEGVSYTFSSLIYFRNPLHCFFESMSAYTTTGLSMAVHEPSVGKGMLFYRSLAQWIGGAGFVVMALAVFKQTSGRSAKLLYGSESTGIQLRPQVMKTAKSIWKVYLYVTIFSTVYLIIGTMLILPDHPLSENIFNSVNHAMTGQSTGGFSTLDNSIAEYNSPFMEMLYLMPMMLGSFSLPFYYKLIYEHKFNEIWKDLQTRALIIAFILGSIIQSLLMVYENIAPSPVRQGIFQFFSAMSTTGWQTSNINDWKWSSVVFIVFAAMFIGGASGATVGGIKMIRFLLIKKGLRWQINKTFFSDNTIKVAKFNGKQILPSQMYEEFTKASSLAIMFLLLLFGSSLITYLITKDNFSYSSSLFEAASAQSNLDRSTLT